MKNINWSNIEAAKPGEFNRLPAGGYICKITAVEDEPSKEYLKIEFDICDGEYKDYYRNLYESKKFWGGNFIKSYKEKALGFFKQMLECIEKSSKGFSADTFDGDERKLVGKFIGLVIGYEEYKGNDGKIKQRIFVDSFKTASEIKNGEFEIPALKTLASDSPKSSAIDAVEDDDDLPWG